MFQGVLRDRDLPLRDRRQGWKHEGQGAPRGRGASCCVSHSQLILSGRSTCSTLSGAPSPWRHDPNKSSNRLQRIVEWRRNVNDNNCSCSFIYSFISCGELYSISVIGHVTLLMVVMICDCVIIFDEDDVWFFFFFWKNSHKKVCDWVN